MFLNTLIGSLKNQQKGFLGKQTLARLSAMPIETIDDRFRLLLELATFADSLKIEKIADGKEEVPNLAKIRRIIAETNSMSHNTLIVKHAFTNLLQELSLEMILATNNKGDFTKIESIYLKNTPEYEFLNIPENTTFRNKVFAFTGKSGREYTGTGVMSIANLNTDDFIDLISGMRLEGRESDLRDYLLNNRKEIETEFKGYRFALLPFVKYHIDPAGEYNKIMIYLNNKVSKPSTTDNGIVHDTVIIDEAANMESQTIKLDAPIGVSPKTLDF